MCTLTLQDEPMIAKGAITVYKVFKEEPWIEENKLITPFESHLYNLNELVKSKMTVHYNGATFDGDDYLFIEKARKKMEVAPSIKYIHEGLHSSTRLKRLTPKHYVTSPRIYARGYIPKNSLYYTTGDGLIVSNRLIITKVLDIKL